MLHECDQEQQQRRHKIGLVQHGRDRVYTGERTRAAKIAIPRASAPWLDDASIALWSTAAPQKPRYGVNAAAPVLEGDMTALTIVSALFDGEVALGLAVTALGEGDE